MISKLVALTAIMMVLPFFDASGGAALAQRNADKTSICPAGTCGKNGARRVKSLKNCKKEYCKKK